jgi:hypothetical protein
MEMESRTCTIRIIDRTTGKGGVLFFQEGKLFDARVDQMKGIHAAYIIFTWEDVTLFIKNECSVKANVINSGLQPIIMKACGMKDEEVTDLPEIDDLIEDDGPTEAEEVPEEEDTEEVPEEEVVEETIEFPDPEPEEEPIIDRIRNLLHQEIGSRCGLQDIYHDGKVDGIISSISELGSMFNFGLLKVGYVNRGKATDEVVIPGDPSIVIKVDPKCPQDKILQVLSTEI